VSNQPIIASDLMDCRPWLAAGHKPKRIAEWLDLPLAVVRSQIGKTSCGVTPPTPVEIRQRAEAIRRTWPPSRFEKTAEPRVEIQEFAVHA